MNEEEIIELVKKEITNTYSEGKAKALQGLLDLYNKEKEKNKELEIIACGIKALEANSASDEIYYLIGKTGFLKGEYKHLLDDYISKDKIKQKIEYYRTIDNAVGALILNNILEE